MLVHGDYDVKNADPAVGSWCLELLSGRASSFSRILPGDPGLEMQWSRRISCPIPWSMQVMSDCASLITRSAGDIVFLASALPHLVFLSSKPPCSQEVALSPLLTSSTDTREIQRACNATPPCLGRRSSVAPLLKSLAIVGDHCYDSLLEDLVDALHLLAAALHVLGVHLACHVHALLAGHRGQALGLEHVDTGLLIAKIGFESHEDERCVGAEV